MWLLATDQRSSVGGERDVPAFAPSCQQKSDLRRNVVMPGRLSLALKTRPIDMISNTAAPVVVSSYRAGLGHLELSTASNVGSDSRIGEVHQVHPSRLYNTRSPRLTAS